jgi:hypothetical protein
VEPFSGGVLDPACGIGRICAAAYRAGLSATGTDLVLRGAGVRQADFLKWPPGQTVANIVSNPPFGIAEQFVAHALTVARGKVAMLLPSKWVQGDERSRWLETTPLRRVLFLTPRPSMPPGAVILAGNKPGNGRTDYAWFVWQQGYSGQPSIGWIRRED